MIVLLADKPTWLYSFTQLISLFLLSILVLVPQTLLSSPWFTAAAVSEQKL